MATLATSGTLSAASPLLPFATREAATVGVEVSGTWTGTITFEVRVGSVYVNAQVFTTAGAGAAATMTANGDRLINVAGFSEVRANFSTPTSGSPVVNFAGVAAAMGGSGGGGGGGAATIGDGADTAEGSTTDNAIQTTTTGSTPATGIALWRGMVNLIVNFLSRLPAALIGGRLDTNVGAIPGTVSTANSSAVALTGGAVFTGTSEDVSACASITVEVFANVASATGGLSFQWSPDGTNWDFTQGVTVAAGVSQSFVLAPITKFFRIVYTNGAGAQASFRLQTIYRALATVKSGAAFQDVNGTLSPTYVGQRLAADMMIQSAADNTTNRMRCAKDLVTAGGVGGGTHIGAGMAHLAIAHGANPTAVTAANFGAGLMNRASVPFTIGGHPNVQTVRANYAAAQTDTALVTIATGLKIVVTRLTVTASKANTVNVSAVIGFGTVNTPTTTGVLLAHPGIDPGGGVNLGAGSGILGVGADDADLRVTCSVPTGGSVDCCVSYYTVES